MAISKQKAAALTRLEMGFLRRLEGNIDITLKENYLPDMPVDIKVKQLKTILPDGLITNRLFSHLIERYRKKGWEVSSSAGESSLEATLHFS